MSGFSAEWLDLREPIDRRSRDAEILAAIAAHFRAHPSVTVTDLACGRGALMCALRDHLPARQLWRLVDHDAALLTLAEAEQGGSVRAQAHRADLSRAVEEILALEADLVTSTAFLDLVSEAWLARLVRGAARAAVPVYLALSYDGRMLCRPAHPLDEAVAAAFHRHQRRDKGFGPALGPEAAASAARRFTAHGYRVMTRRADWQLAAAERAMQERMVMGWFAAVSELAAVPPADLAAWRDQRLAWIAEVQSEMVVGHVDLWAVPPTRRSQAR